jgi:hypothetical protein
VLCWLDIDPSTPALLRDAPRPTVGVGRRRPQQRSRNDARNTRAHARPLGGQVDYADLDQPIGTIGEQA